MSFNLDNRYEFDTEAFRSGLRLQYCEVKACLGSLLLRIRKRDRSLTQAKVARGAGISVHTLYTVERDSLATVKTILRIYYYYRFIGHITPAEARLFQYIFMLLWRF